MPVIDYPLTKEISVLNKNVATGDEMQIKQTCLFGLLCTLFVSSSTICDASGLTIPNRITQLTAKAPLTYMVINLSRKDDTGKCQMFYLSKPPQGGWNDTFKTTHLVMRRIPAGTFQMGSPLSEKGRSFDEPLHPVTIQNDYYIGVFEITQHQWRLIMNRESPSQFETPLRPVESISYKSLYNKKKGFLDQLTQHVGIAFDLPTEEEWEYACRSGTTSAINTGCNLFDYHIRDNVTDPSLLSIAKYRTGLSLRSNKWWMTDSEEAYMANTTSPVGCCTPNHWGLYDMHGNVAEWCKNWYAPYPNQAEKGDYPLPQPHSMRVIRGGSWYQSSSMCRSADRFYKNPNAESIYVGFRIVTKALPHNTQE